MRQEIEEHGFTRGWINPDGTTTWYRRRVVRYIESNDIPTMNEKIKMRDVALELLRDAGDKGIRAGALKRRWAELKGRQTGGDSRSTFGSTGTAWKALYRLRDEGLVWLDDNDYFRLCPFDSWKPQDSTSVE